MDQKLQTTLYSLIPEELKPQIDEALNKLREVYNDIEGPRPLDLDFSQPALKHAYFYRYFVCISNTIRECWRMLIEQGKVHFVESFRENSEINVCCVGGGPGTDLVGLCQFLKECNIQIKLNATILDYHDWSAEARYLLAASEAGVTYVYGIANFQYVPYDLFEKPITVEVIDKIQSADLVTVVMFLSAVVGGYEGVQQFKDLLSLMKPNARLFFVDNSGGPSKKRMYSAAQRAGLRLVSEIIHERIYVSEYKSNTMASECFRTFPKKSNTVSASLWIKVPLPHVLEADPGNVNVFGQKLDDLCHKLDDLSHKLDDLSHKLDVLVRASNPGH